VQPDGGGPGSAVEDEGQRPGALIAGAIAIIRDEEDAAFDDASRVVADRQHACRRGVGERRAVEAHRVVRHDGRRFDDGEEVARARPE